MDAPPSRPPASAPPDTTEWLELFFDLVVVVCLGLLAERLHEHADAAGLGVFVVVFAAIWLTWTSFVIYADIASDATHVVVLMSAAGLIGLMTTTLTDLDARANTFAIAFVVCRIIAARASLRTGRLLTSWPAVQLGGLSTIWIASIWVDPPAKYAMWGAAVAVELGLAVLRASDDPEADEAMVARVNARVRRKERPGGRVLPEMVVARIRADHLGERLGLFVIIVLGEGLTEVIQAASQTEWSRSVRLGGVAAFLVIVCLWWLIFHHRLGFGGAALGVRAVLPLHLFATASLVLLAAALGQLLLEAGHSPEAFWRWAACGAAAAWFALASLVAAIEGAAPRWIASRSAASVVAAVGVGAAAGGLDAEWVIVLLLAVVAWTALAPAPALREAAVA